MVYVIQFDKPTAYRVAELLERDGNPHGAASVWWQLLVADPYDRVPREHFANLSFALHNVAARPADVDKSRLILRIIGISLATPCLVEAYFENLRQLLAARPKRPRPGLLVLGLGSGRCGSTTLTSVMAGLPDCCATHENPPALFWDPGEENLRMHVDRFRTLRDYFDVVFDASHWWLNPFPRLLAEFPDLRAIGLVRDTETCVASFLAQKGSGPGSPNHWAVPGNGIWASGPGDPSYPSYAVPAGSANPDEAKRTMITRYVTEYNQSLERLAAAHADHVLLVRTEELADPATCARISQFLGREVPPPDAALNVGDTADSHNVEWVF